MGARTSLRVAEDVPARKERRNVEPESTKLAVRDDRIALRMHVEHETVAVGKVDLDLASDVSIAIIGRTNLNREIGREGWPLALKLGEFPKPSA